MKQITNREKVLVIALLALTAFCTLTKTKNWNYKKTKSYDYNKIYNDKHPVIDTIQVLYKNSSPIFVRSGFNINGHEKIGFCNGGSQIWFECSDSCEKCLNLHRD